MKVWISRDFDDCVKESCVNITGNKPYLGTEEEYKGTWIFPSSGYLGFMKAEEFEEAFNIKIPRGYCKQHIITISSDPIQ